MSKRLKKEKISTFVIVSILILSLLVVGVGIESEESDTEPALERSETDEEKDIVLIMARNEEEKGDIEEKELNILDTYENFILIEESPSVIQFLKDEGYRVNTLPSRTEISVKGHSFDIKEEDHPNLDLKADSYESGVKNHYIVHMLGPINPEWVETLEEKGVELLNYIPNHAYEVKMTPEQAEELKELFFIDWIGKYHPEYKISPEFSRMKENLSTVDVKLMPHATDESVGDISSEFHVNMSSSGSDKTERLRVDITSERELKELAKMDEVYHISEYREPELHSEVDSQIIGGGAWIMDDEHDDPDIPYRKHGDYGAYINQIGYSGKDVTIAVADTGIGEGFEGDAGHPDLTDRVIGGHGFEELGPEDWYDPHGHGTHVSGSAAGDTYHGAEGEGEYPGQAPYLMGQGLAYESELFAAKIFEPSWVGADYHEIVEIPKQEADAYIHTNSWGSATGGEYIESDRIFDERVRDANRDSEDNEEMVVTVSAGNSGSREQTTGSPGNAKNVITVGATESYMPDGTYFGGGNTNDPGQIARFSSRGWTEDNRVKPDVVAPGRNVLSLGNPSFHEGGTYDWMSGTSMSNPAVAGASAVVVEWYEENFGEKPSPAMVKAMLINTAEDIDSRDCIPESIPNKDIGWGMVDISKLEYPKEDPVPFALHDQNNALSTGDEKTYEIEAEREDEPLKISLVWTDAAAAEGDNRTLKNNLNLEVKSPSGDVYRGNSFSDSWSPPNRRTMSDFDSTGDGWDDSNNVQNVYIHPDKVEDGTYEVRVQGFEITADGNNDGDLNQDYALAVYNSQDPDTEFERDEEGSGRSLGEELEAERSNESDLNYTDEPKTINRYKQRDPINVESNTELTEKAEREGWSGDGSEDDPYKIKNYEIDGKSENSTITISNVNQHFVIKDSRLYNASRTTSSGISNCGIYLLNVSNAQIENNYLRRNSYGIFIDESDEIVVRKNSAENNHAGIRITDSEKINVEENTVSKVHYPVYGEGIALESSNEIELKHNTIFNNAEGVFLAESDDNKIFDNNISYNQAGVQISYSEDNTFADNGFYKNSRGVALLRSDYNTLTENKASHDDDGFYLSYSDNNNFTENILSNNLRGIRSLNSEGNEYRQNSISQSESSGIHLSSSQYSEFFDNSFEDSSIYISGNEKEYWNTHTIDESNKIEGKPILYLEDTDDFKVTEEDEVGQVILANSRNITISGQEMKAGDTSILIGFSNNNKIFDNYIEDSIDSITLQNSERNRIENNRIFNGTAAIYLRGSDKNRIIENNLVQNEWPGVYLSSSHKNLISGNIIQDSYHYGVYLSNSYDNAVYHNSITHEDFFEDIDGQAYDNSDNSWDNGTEGNYWDDYELRYPDATPDDDLRTWNEPYIIAGDGNKDMNPLLSIEQLDDFTVWILDPRENTTIFSSEFTGSWATKGGEGEVEYKIHLNDEEWSTIDEYMSFENLEDGEHELKVQAEDEEGATASHEITFFVHTGPHVEIISPEKGDIERRGTVSIEWTAHNYAKTEIKLDGPVETDWEDVTGMDEHTYRDLDDGNYSVSIRIEDEEGEEAIDEVDFTVKTVRVEINSPASGEVIKGDTVTINWSSENAEYHEFQICGGRWDNLGNKSSHEISGLGEGHYTVRIRARDETQRFNTDSVNFEINMPEADLNITNPEDGRMYATRDLTLEWEYRLLDEDLKIEYFEYRLNKGNWIEIGNVTEYSIEDLDDGENKIELRANLKETYSVRDEVIFLVDTVPPTLNISAPEDQDTLEKTDVMVEWIGEDDLSGIDSYEIRIIEDGEKGDWIYLGRDTEYTFIGLEDGEYTVEVRARDRVGNTITESVTFEVRRDRLEFSAIYLVIGVIAALFVVRLAVFKLRKKHKKIEKEIEMKTVAELEDELELVDYDEYEDDYRL